MGAYVWLITVLLLTNNGFDGIAIGLTIIIILEYILIDVVDIIFNSKTLPLLWLDEERLM